MREYECNKYFEFDAVNQLLKTIDNGGNETLSGYDLAGRRTQVIHPVSGETNLTYDNAGNVLTRQTANLKEENRVIVYDYDYNRPVTITYPDHPENNVKMTYGNKNAAFNRVGRLMLQEDATGAQEFFYDRLGNPEKVRRTVIIPNQAIATYVTEWRYDSWNRLTEMIYPDLEKISYSYNTGGLLESVKGQKSYSYNYVNKIGYDKFEQRTYMKYCNGAETNYTYDAERRRLSNLMVVSGKDTRKQIMNNNYAFDAVDNVLSVTNTAPLPSTGQGGQMNHTYNYDGLYRLTSASGSYTGADSKVASYNLEMAYDNLHNITSKKQHIQQSGIVFDGVLKAGYDLSYNYANNPLQISTLADENYRTEGDADKDKITNEHAYKYDANGNLIYVNTSREKQDGTKESGNGEKKYLWDEENRLLAVNTNGFISSYWYDASGERVIKASGDDEGIYVNGLFSGARTETSNFTAYINPYLVVSKGGNYTKHIYIGSQRIVSKLGDLDSYGQDPRRIPYAGADVEGADVDYAGKYKESQQTIKDRYGDFEVPYYGKDNDDYVNGGGFCCDDNPSLRAGAIGNGNDNPEVFQYYYHSDHLGSTSLITNLDGEVVQHVEYVPFGEVFIEERNNKWNTPYLFNAKELDEETGLYYYGFRYLDSKTSLWLSTDPLQEKYPGISTYAYCALNPVKFIDPDGMDTDVVQNEDNTYTVVNANNNKDNNIYLVNSAGKRTGETIGTTLQPTDFMITNDQTNEFLGHVDITFDLNKLTVSGTVHPNKHTTATINNADAQKLLDWGQELFRDEVKRQSPLGFLGELLLLEDMASNYDPSKADSGHGSLDFKSSLGLNLYTPIKAGNTSDGKPIITVLRAVGNIIFGANMRSTKPFLLGTPLWYYKQIMPTVGAYNQKQNTGNGYNPGFPYYGEHSYSGSYIYYGYFGHFY